jgi:hypothetical protein
MDLSVEHVAPNLRIATGTLRNIEANQPRAMVSDRLARRAARFFNVSVDELVVDGDTVPDGPPTSDQQTETNTGPGRKDGSGPTGPKRRADLRRSA